jgi:hypothetical protein
LGGTNAASGDGALAMINAFALVCALVWGFGLFHLTAEMPPLSPTQERICQLYARPGDAPAATAPLPAEIGPLATYGRPYWGTWMPPYTPLEPAGTDPYPACMARADVLAVATDRHTAAWDAWRGPRMQMALIWAVAPLGGLPLLWLAGLFLAGLPKRTQKKAPAPSRGGVEKAAAQSASNPPSSPPRLRPSLSRTPSMRRSS